MPRFRPVARLALSLLLFLLGCEVSRDLRPELFACDAGGICNEGTQDAGSNQVSCPVGGNCTCRDGETCRYRCTGQCSIDCLTGSKCELACQVAECNTTCMEGAECTVMCQAASCNTTCEEGAVCELNCPLGSSCSCSGPACP